MAFTEDFDVFFDDDDFGVTATFTPRSGTGGGPTTINGIFDKEFVAVGDVGDVEMAGTDPVFMCKTSEVPNARGGTLKIDTTTYNIVTDKPDGTGITMLALEDAS